MISGSASTRSDVSPMLLNRKSESWNMWCDNYADDAGDIQSNAGVEGRRQSDEDEMVWRKKKT